MFFNFLKAVFVITSLRLRFTVTKRNFPMCLTPVTISNSNRNILSKNTELSPYYDTESSHILVPCGRCASCIALKQNYIVQRVQMEEKDNLIFMGMLSYNSQTLPSLDVNGYNIKYADIRHVQDMFRYIRKWTDLPPFRYMVTSEFGGERHRPHFHFLLFFPKSYVNSNYDRITRSDCESLRLYFWDLFLKYWRHNVGSRKNPKWIQNLTFRQVGRKRNYDLQWVDTLQDFSASAFYTSKYVCKASDYVDRLKSALYFNTGEDFESIWKTVKPKFLFSKGFGNPYSELVSKHIRFGINIALQDDKAVYPYYFSPHNGSCFPLAPYYRQKFLSADEELVFRQRLLDLSETGVISDQPIDKTPYEIEQSIKRFEKVKKLINQRDEDIHINLDEQYFNYQTFISQDYGNIPRSSSEDFTVPDDWEDTFAFGDSDCDFCDSLF